MHAINVSGQTFRDRRNSGHEPNKFDANKCVGRSRIENNNVTFCLFFLELYFGESAHSHTTLRTDSVSAAGCWQHSPLVAVSALFPMGSSRSRANPQSPSSFNNHHQRPSSVRTGFPRPASRVSLRCLAPACAECSRRDATRCAFPCGQHAAVRARRLPHACVAASTAAHSGRTEGTVDSRHQRKLSLGARVCVGDVRVHRVSPRLARQAIVTCKDVLRQRSDRARTGGMCV